MRKEGIYINSRGRCEGGGEEDAIILEEMYSNEESFAGVRQV